MNLKRRPLQDRSKETREKILHAAMALFRDKGYDAVNTKDITQAAGVAVGSFYVYFADKKELFKEVIDLFFKKLADLNLGQYLKVTPGKTRQELMEEMIKTVIGATKDLGCIFKDLHLHFYNDENIGKLIEAFAYGISMQLLQESDCQVNSCPEVAHVAYMLIENTIHHLLYHGTDIPREVIITEVARCLSLYLFGTTGQ